MINRQISNNICDRLIDIAIVVLFFVPFVIPYGYFPVSKFYSEALALITALFIGVVGIYRAERVSISSAGIACFLFAILLLLQIVILPIRLPGVNMFVAMQVFIGGILSIGIVSLIDGKNDVYERLLHIIAWVALMSVTVQGIYGVMQYTGAAAQFKSLILYVGSGASDIFGNIGQKNDYVDFIAIGVFALTYLYIINRINKIVFTIYALFLGFVITITTSRTAFVFFIAAIIIAACFMFINRKNPAMKLIGRRVLLVLITLFIGLFVMEAIVPKIVSLFAANQDQVVTSGLYRFGKHSIQQSTFRRFFEWYKDIIIFIHHPLFGIGWYQYPREAIYLMNTPRFMYIPDNSALYTHSHNSPLNILAESGLIGFLITMVYGFGYTIYRMFKKFNNVHALFAVFMLLPIFIQGLFQYPLWYAYFLMFFVLFLSLDKPIYSIANSKTIKGIAIMLFAGFIVFFGVNIPIYNQLTAAAIVPQDIDDYTNNVNQLRQIIDHNPLWALPGLMALDGYIMPTTPVTNAALSAEDQEYYIDKLGNELPYPGEIFKQLVIHKVVGDNVGSMQYAILLAHAYPYFKDQFAAQLAHSPIFSNEVAAIQGFKYEDRSIFARIFHLQDN